MYFFFGTNRACVCIYHIRIEPNVCFEPRRPLADGSKPTFDRQSTIEEQSTIVGPKCLHCIQRHKVGLTHDFPTKIKDP